MNKNKRNIIYFMDFADSLENADRVGSVTRIIRYFNALSEHSITINILSPDLKNYSSLLSDSKHYPLPAYSGSFRHIVFLIFSPIIFRTLMRDAHLYWAKFSSSIPAMIAKTLYRKPIVNYFDYNWVELSRASKEGRLELGIKWLIEHLMIRYSDYFITTTDTLKSYLINMGFRYPEKIFIIPNYVDTDLFVPSSEAHDNKMFKILSVGRLSEQKNFPLLLQGVSRLQELTDKQIKLTIVGAGPLKEALLSEASARKVSLTIIDRIPNSEMHPLYTDNHLFVMTSPREGHPRALIEAMACGLPIVGTNVTGISDIIKDNDDGLLCDENRDSVANQILRIINDKELAARLGENARKQAVARYSFKALLEKESLIYKQIFADAERHSRG